MILYKLSRQAAVLLISLLLFPAMLSAQSLWVDHGEEKTYISVEIIKPIAAVDSIYKDFWYTELQPEYTALSGAIIITGKYALGKNFVLAADLSIAHGELVGEKYDSIGSQTIFGNPYIGAEYHLPKTPLFFELGFRIPVVPDKKGVASISGIYSDFDRAGAFYPHIVPVSGAVNFEKITKWKLLLRARTGVTLWFNSKKVGAFRSPTLFVNYMLQTGYYHPRVTFIVGLAGVLDANSNPKYPEKVHILQYGATITVPFGNFRPGINFRIPGNKTSREFIDYAFGLNLTYVFNNPSQSKKKK